MSEREIKFCVVMRKKSVVMTRIRYYIAKTHVALHLKLQYNNLIYQNKGGWLYFIFIHTKIRIFGAQ